MDTDWPEDIHSLTKHIEKLNRNRSDCVNAYVRHIRRLLWSGGLTASLNVQLRTVVDGRILEASFINNDGTLVANELLVSTGWTGAPKIEKRHFGVMRIEQLGCEALKQIAETLDSKVFGAPGTRLRECNEWLVADRILRASTASPDTPPA